MIPTSIESYAVNHVVVDATTELSSLASFWVALEPGTGSSVLVATGDDGYELLAERGFARVGFIGLADISIGEIMKRMEVAA